MMTLMRIAEFIIIAVVIRSLLKVFKLSGKAQATRPAQPGKTPERFDGKKQDISDGDYEEMR